MYLIRNYINFIIFPNNSFYPCSSFREKKSFLKKEEEEM